jgi:hypothetical protein
VTRPPRRRAASPKRPQAVTPAGIEEEGGCSTNLDIVSMSSSCRAAVGWIRDHRGELDALLSAALDRSLPPDAGDGRTELLTAGDDRLALRRAAEAIEKSAPFLVRFILLYVAVSGRQLDDLRAVVSALSEGFRRLRPPIAKED